MKRWISAPDTNGQPANGAVLGVSLDDNELVEWAYTFLPDGKKLSPDTISGLFCLMIWKKICNDYYVSTVINYL